MCYQQSVNTLAKAREDWIKEHVNTCEVKIVSVKAKTKRLAGT